MLNVSDDFRHYILDLENASVLIWLITFAHDGDVRYRLCSYHESIISNSKTFNPSPIVLRIPKANLLRRRTDGGIRLEGVTRFLTQWIRVDCRSAPTITLEAVLLNSPDSIELGPLNYTAGRITINKDTISMPLSANELFKKPFQSVAFDPTRTPALFL